MRFIAMNSSPGNSPILEIIPVLCLMQRKNLLKLTLLLASMMTMMAGAVVSPSLPQIAEVFADVKYSAILTRLVITLPALFIALSSPFYGKYSDRIGRKNLFLFALVLYALGGSSGYYLDNIYLILLGRVVLGIAVGGIMTLTLALIGDHFEGKERTAFVGLRGAFTGLGGVFFIVVAGWLADIQWQLPFLIYLYAVPILILVLLFVNEPEHILTKRDTEPIELGYNRKLVALVYFLAFITVVFFYMIPVQIPFLLTKMENISNSRIGYAISTSTLVSALFSINYKRIKPHFTFKQLYQIGFICIAIAYSIISQANSYGIVILGLAFAGMGTGVLFPSASLWMMEIAPEKIRGTLLGRVSMAVFLGMFVSPLVIQPFINGFGIEASFLIAACMMLLLAASIFLLKEM
jgi:MFS family permease